MGLTVRISWSGLRGCRLGAAMMTIVGIVGHNPVGVCSPKTTKYFWGHQGILDDGRGYAVLRLGALFREKGNEVFPRTLANKTDY